MKGPVTNCELLHLFCTSVVASEAVSERSEINPGSLQAESGE